MHLLCSIAVGKTPALELMRTPRIARFASNLRSLYQELPRSDTLCRITGTIQPISILARQLPLRAPESGMRG
jgi:hypothetical protein